MRLGQLLIEEGLITAEQLRLALRNQQINGGRLGTNLVELGFVSEATLTALLSSTLHVPTASLPMIDRAHITAIRLLSGANAERYRACPLGVDGSRLHVAMANPSDKTVIAKLVELTGYEVRPFLASDPMIEHALRRHYGIVPRTATLEVEPEEDFSIETDLFFEELPTDTSGGALAFPNQFQGRAESSRVVPLDASPHLAAAPAAAAAPATAPAPSPGSRARFTLADFSARLLEARSQADVADATVAFVGQDFSKVVMLLHRAGSYSCWRGWGHGLSDALRGLALSEQDVPWVTQALHEGTPHVVAPSHAVLGPLAVALSAPTDRAVLILPIRCADRAVGSFVAVGGREGVESQLPDYAVVARKLDYAFQVLVLRKHIAE